MQVQLRAPLVDLQGAHCREALARVQYLGMAWVPNMDTPWQTWTRWGAPHRLTYQAGVRMEALRE